MELNSKSVQVSNVQWSKIMVECVVQEGIVDGEVAWWYAVPLSDKSWPVDSSGRTFAWRTASRWVGVWKEGVC